MIIEQVLNIMPDNFKNEDVRIQKTKEALMGAMSKLLELQNFNQITINDLCKEAQIGRTTFYAHFHDKYDLLKIWLTKTKSEIKRVTYIDTEKKINDFMNNNIKVIRHLIEDANSETLGLLCEFMLSLLDIDNADIEKISPKYSVLSKFCCGGIMNYLEWQINNKSKADLKIMNSYFYDILDTMHEWNKEDK